MDLASIEELTDRETIEELTDRESIEELTDRETIEELTDRESIGELTDREMLNGGHWVECLPERDAGWYKGQSSTDNNYGIDHR